MIFVLSSSRHGSDDGTTERSSIRHARLHEVSSDPKVSPTRCSASIVPPTAPALATSLLDDDDDDDDDDDPFSTVRNGALAACAPLRRPSSPSSDLRLLFLLNRAEEDGRFFLATDVEDAEADDGGAPPLLPCVLLMVLPATGVSLLAFAPVRYLPSGSVRGRMINECVEVSNCFVPYPPPLLFPAQPLWSTTHCACCSSARRSRRLHR